MKKRVVFISDPHCGHKFGLTPPAWWAEEETGDDRLSKHRTFQRELWGAYAEAIDGLLPIDILVANGDMIDGKGEKTGGTELITTDRLEQVRMAKTVIDTARARSVRILYGTGYHVGRDEDFESMLGDIVECRDTKVSGHLFLDVNGLIFDIKHKIGRSAIPHGRVTPLIRAAMWNAMWSIRDRQPKAKVIIRSHVHYYEKWENDEWMGIITPALCYNSIYGVRDCEGVVNLGLVYFDVCDQDEFEAQWVKFKFDELQVHAESI